MRKNNLDSFIAFTFLGDFCGDEAIMDSRKINDKWIIEKYILLGVL